MASTLASRRNLVLVTEEAWQPPLHAQPDTRIRRSLSAVRRLFDLQLGSIWRDLEGELESARGIVLDVGCGAQPFRPLIAPSASYVGIDTVNAKSHFGYEIPDTIYFDGATWPIDTGSVDIVLCTETLEHVLEPSLLLDEAHRALRAGGRLILTVPFSARWHFIPHDYWRYTPASLDHLLRKAGFSDVRVYARGNAATVACYKCIALVLPFLIPSSGGVRSRFLQLLALLTLPVVLVLALIGQASLRGRGGDDCLGFTVTASSL